jgi:sulfonate transport system substrate-binding protein
MKKMLAALAVALLSLAGQAAAAGKPKEIRIGVALVGAGGRPLTGGSAWPIVADKGALEEEFRADGIRIQVSYFTGAGPAVNEAFANDQLDFAFQGDLPGLVARAGGLPTKLILAQGRFSGIYVAVPASSPARSLEDLKGKRIAVFKGTAWQLAFYRALQSRGLKESDFRIINMSTVDGTAALLSNDIDALVSGSDVFALAGRGAAKVVYSSRGDPDLGILSHVLVTERFASKHPQIVQRVVNVFLKEGAWLAQESNRARAYEIWVKSGFGLPAWKGDFDGDPLRDRTSPLFDDYYRAQYRRLLKAGRDLKLVRKDFDVDQWLDPTFLNQGLVTLGLQHTWREFDAAGKPKPSPVVQR